MTSSNATPTPSKILNKNSTMSTMLKSNASQRKRKVRAEAKSSHAEQPNGKKRSEPSYRISLTMKNSYTASSNLSEPSVKNANKTMIA